MAVQAIFKKCVQHHFPSAFVTTLEKVDEFIVGTVLIPRYPWYRRFVKDLDFAGIPISFLVAPGEDEQEKLSNLKTECTSLFTDVEETSSDVCSLGMKLDSDLKAALVDLGVNLSGQKKDAIDITVDFGGNIKHRVCNVYDILASHQFTVDMNHPIIEEAVSKGRELFIITSTYIAKKVVISIIRERDSKLSDSARETASTVQSASVGASFTDYQKSVQVIRRDAPTVIAFNIMKVTIDKEGRLIPENKSGYETHHEIHFPYGDVYALHNLELRRKLKTTYI